MITYAPTDKIQRAVMQCDYCGRSCYVPGAGPFEGRTDLCTLCASGDTQRRDREEEDRWKREKSRAKETLAVAQVCTRCTFSFHATRFRRLCHGCEILYRHDKVCCDQAFYRYKIGDPCGFRICRIHGNVNVEPVD